MGDSGDTTRQIEVGTDMTPGGDQWEQVAAAIGARMDSLHLSKADLIRESGITRPTLNEYLAGKQIVSNKKAWALCTALGWTDDSIDRILRGGQPAARAAGMQDDTGLRLADTDDLMLLLDDLQLQQRSVIDETGRRARDN